MKDLTLVTPFHLKYQYQLLWLKKAIDSALMQKYIDFDYIIVNDGSIINPPESWFNDERIKYFKKDKIGLTNSAMFATRQGEGKYRCNLSYDDYLLHDDDLFIRYKLAEENPDALLIWTNGFKVDEEENIIREFIDPGKINGIKYAKKGVMINASTRILRRDIYLNFPLNPKYTTGEEYDQQVRLLYWAEQNGFCFKYFPQYYTIANRQHNEQKSKNLTHEERMMRLEIRKKK